MRVELRLLPPLADAEAVEQAERLLAGAVWRERLRLAEQGPGGAEQGAGVVGKDRSSG